MPPSSFAFLIAASASGVRFVRRKCKPRFAHVAGSPGASSVDFLRFGSIKLRLAVSRATVPMVNAETVCLYSGVPGCGSPLFPKQPLSMIVDARMVPTQAVFCTEFACRFNNWRSSAWFITAQLLCHFSHLYTRFATERRTPVTNAFRSTSPTTLRIFKDDSYAEFSLSNGIV